MTLATLWQGIADPWSEPLVRRAGLEVVLLGLVAGMLGCWIVLYELSYGAESLSHALFPGLVVATLVGVPLLVGGAAGLTVAVAAIWLAQRVEGIGADTAVGVAITSLVGLGALLALSQASPPGIGQLLFGDVLAVSDGDLLGGFALAALVLAGLRFLHGQLLLAGFDRSNARALGGRPSAAEALLLVLVAATIVVAVQALGNLLVVALLVGPASAARLVSDRLPSMMALGAAAAILGGIGGLYLSYYAGTAGGASIALAILALYLLAGCAGALLRARGSAVR